MGVQYGQDQAVVINGDMAGGSLCRGVMFKQSERRERRHTSERGHDGLFPGHEQDRLP